MISAPQPDVTDPRRDALVTSCPACRVASLGRIPYKDAWNLQTRLARLRGDDAIPDTLLLLEHPPTYTLGRVADPSNLLVPRERLGDLGIEIFDVDRGGDITYHGPGQLVGYPILLIQDRRDLLRYIRQLEEVLILTLAEFGIKSLRIDGLSGVWVEQEKVAAVGVKMGRVTSHGFALNVITDLSYFQHIIPCGIRHKGVTSMERLLTGARGAQLSVADVVPVLVDHFGAVFERQMVWSNAVDVTGEVRSS